MAISPNIAEGQNVKVAAGWFSGMNTIRHPWLLRPDQYVHGVNVINRGGLVQTRNGYGMRLILPPGNLQGGFHFHANKGDLDQDYLIAAVEGNVYAIPFPLTQPRSWESLRLKGISFDPTAKFVYFESAEKTVETLSDQSLRIVPTYNVLMLQDGVNQAAFWDGELQGHLDETAPALGTPRGTWMKYSGGRLWVARGKILIACDYRDPLRAVERTQGEGRGDFSFNRDITGLAGFSDGDRNEVLTAFTVDRSYLLKSGIQQRAKWSTTENFQSILFPSTGCVSGHSVVFQAGLLWWYSQGGLVSSDSAASSFLTSQVNYKDAEMAFSKQFMAQDQSGICGLSFENFLLMSMPIGESLNSETFVLDYATMSEASAEKIPAWASVWKGIRPMQWVNARINGQQRAFAMSVDYAALSDGSHNHVWEAFLPERYDTFFELDSDFKPNSYKQPIYCEWGSAALGDGPDLKVMEYAELDFRELSGDVNIRVDYKGTRGRWKEILCKKIIATTSYESSGVDNFEEKEAELGLLKRQSRRLRTKTASRKNPANCEDTHDESVDKYFQLLVRWCGEAALESIRMTYSLYPEKTQGGNEKPELKANVVDEFGKSYVYDREKGFIPEDELYEQIASQIWISVKNYTEELTCGPGSITGPIRVTATATYRSQISQADADIQAEQAAQQAAEGKAEYYRSLYPCYWDGTASSTRTCYAALNGAVRTVSIQASTGFAILGGAFTQDQTTSQNRVSGRDPNGLRWLAFCQGSGFNDVVYDSVVDELDRIILVGAFTSYNGSTANRIIRLLGTGEIDPTFNSGTGFNNTAYTVALQGSKLIVGGAFDSYDGVSTSGPGIIRLLNTGVRDGTFTPDPDIVEVYKLSVNSSGAIAIIANISSLGTIRALDPDGSMLLIWSDYTFTLASTTELAIKFFDDGKIIVGASGITKNIQRLNSDGTTDGSFMTGSGPNGAVSSILVHSNGSLYLAGAFTSLNGSTQNRVARTDINGSPDSTFRTNMGTGANASAYEVQQAIDGTIILGGVFTAFNSGTNSAYLVYLSPQGHLLPKYEETIQYAAARSKVSQTDANNTAQDLADAKAVAALPCT